MPLPIGTKVYYLVSPSRAAHGPCLAEGKVRRYIKSTHSEPPYYTVDVLDGDAGTVQIVKARNVAKKTKEGKKKILRLIGNIYLESAQYHAAKGFEYQVKANQIDKEIESL